MFNPGLDQVKFIAGLMNDGSILIFGRKEKFSHTVNTQNLKWSFKLSKLG